MFISILIIKFATDIITYLFLLIVYVRRDMFCI
nr:MAG TPA_asm: hypothetical protein [Caudoviricetes sp.]